MIAKQILPIILLILFAGCGTIQGYRDIIILDSNPRNIKVSDEDGQFLNNTPFFHQASSQRKQNFIFEGINKSGNTFKHHEFLSCQFDWERSLIPSGILLAIPPTGTIIGGASLLIDTISGGLYECSKSLSPIFKDALMDKKVLKRKILILPPFVVDEVISNKIIATWVENQFNLSKEANEEIIPLESAKSELEYLGITNEKHITVTKLKKKFLLRLGYKFQFTHILYLKVDESSRNYSITPILYDAFTTKEIKTKYSSNFGIVKSEHILKTHIKWLLKAITILPNTFQVGQSTRPTVKFTSNVFDVSNLDNDKDGEIDTQRHPDSLPRILTSFSLGVAENPYHYSTWDANFSIFPTFSSSSWLSHLSNETTTYDIQLYNFNVFSNAGINLHTIIGAFGINLGYGGVWFIGKDSVGKNYNKVDNAIRTNLSYVAFITENFYFRGDYSNYNLKGHKITSDYYRLNAWSEFYFAVGYYFPTIRSIVRKILPF